MSRDKSIVGDLINFRGLVYAPLNENGVVFLFGRVADDLHMYIEEIKPGFPDCVARRFTGKGWERVLIEFEYLSSNFKQHGHDPQGCDMIVCWENDWLDCPLEVIELRSEIQSMQNRPIKHPSTTVERDGGGEKALLHLYTNMHVPPLVQGWYQQIEQALRTWNSDTWTNVGKKYIGFYSPEKAFASLSPKPNSLQIEYFSRGEPLAGTRVAHVTYSPRWAKFSVKKSDQVTTAIETLKEACNRTKAAIKAGEPTGYFSGGIHHPTAIDETDTDPIDEVEETNQGELESVDK